MGDDNEFIKLPLQQRCVHKLWKARVHGYTEAVKVFQEEEEKSPVFLQYAPLLSKFVGDSNAVAQEKGLEATLYFVQNAAIAGKTIKDVVSTIIAKSIAAPKKSTQELSTQIILMYIEIEKQESVIEELLKGMEHKNPKIVSACISVATLSLKEFGSQVVSVKSFVKVILSLLEDRDKTVREGAKTMIIEMYRWVGDAIKPQLANLKPIQLTDLEEEFGKVKGTKAIPTRYLKSQQEKQAKMAAAAEEDVNDSCDIEASEEKEIDPLSLVDAINVLTKVPNDFYDNIEAKKWQDRKEALDNLEKILDYPKFEKNDYGDLVRALTKVVSKDSNVVVVGIAIKCIARLAQGLGKFFQPYSHSTLSQLLPKFKEKKVGVVTPLREAVDAIFISLNFEAVVDDLISFLDQKNPSIKAETASYLARCFAKTSPTVLNKKFLKSICGALLKTLNESDPTVRDNAAEALGTCMKVVGEKVFLPFIADIDALKAQKIKECCDKAVVKVAKVEREKPVAKAAPTPKKVLSGGAQKIQEKFVETKKGESEEGQKEKEKPKEGKADIGMKLTEQMLQDLDNKNWKVRNDTLVLIIGMVEEAKNIKSNLGELPTALNLRFQDTNGKIVVKTFELCEALAKAMGPACKIHVKSFLRGFFIGLGDNKQWVRQPALSCLNTWFTTAGPKEFFTGEFIPDALKAGSPQLRIELWNWLVEVLMATKGIPKDDLIMSIPHLFTALEDRNAEVRKSANFAVLGMMMHVGFNNMLKEAEKLKPSSKSNITTVIEKTRGDLPLETQISEEKPKSAENKNKPVVKANPRSVKTKGRPSLVVKPTQKEEEVCNSPLLIVNKLKNQRMLDEQKLKILKWNFTSPRPEFVELLKDQATVAGFSKTLVANMFHTDFQRHLKAIEMLNDDLVNLDALMANLDLILKWMTLRFFDTNPSVLLRGLEYLQTAFGYLTEESYCAVEVEANSFIPYLVLKVGDPKDAVRDRVHAILKQFSLIYSPTKLFSHIMEGVKSKNSRQRTECLDELGYLIEQFGVAVCAPNPPTALKEIAKQIADRDNSVRSAALNAIVKAYNSEGEQIYKMVGKLPEKDLSLLEERIKRSAQTKLKMKKEEPKPVLIAIPEPERSPPQLEEESELIQNEEPERVVNQTVKRFVPPEPPKLNLIPIDLSFLDQPIPMPDYLAEKIKQSRAIVVPPIHPILEETFRMMVSANIDVAIDGNKRLYGVLESYSADRLEPNTNQIVETVALQLKSVNTYTVQTHESNVHLLYKANLSLIGEIFEKKIKMAQQVEEGVLKIMLRELLIGLVDDKSATVKDDVLFKRLIVKYLTNIMDNADFTNVLCATIDIVHDLVGTPPENPKLTEKVLSYLLKLISLIRAYNGDIGMKLTLCRVLNRCHLFMVAYPKSTWKSRPSELPSRSINTLLLHLVEKKGKDIMSHLRLIDNGFNSELGIYLKKLIEMLKNESKHKRTKMTNEMVDHLRMVFQKIGHDDTRDEALVEYYEFKKRNPDIDLTTILKPTTQSFRDFLEDGLRKIEKERGPLVKKEGPQTPKTPNTEAFHLLPQISPPENPQLLPQYHLDWIKNYQRLNNLPVSPIPDFKV